MSKCGSVDSLYGEVASKLGLRLKGPPPASRMCTTILAYLRELALKLNLPDDVAREAERVVLELSMRGFRAKDVRVVAVAVAYLACRLKGYTLSLRHIVHETDQMGWSLDYASASRKYREIVKYLGITPPPQSREQAEQARRMYQELVRSETIREAKWVEEGETQAPVEGSEAQQAPEQPPPPFHIAYIRSVAERLELPEAVVEDAISMVERFGVTRTSVVSAAIYLSCLKHGVEIDITDLEGFWDDAARMLIEALELANARSFLAVRAYKRIISWAETGCIQMGRYYVRHIPKTKDGVVELKWMEFMDAFDVAPVMMSIKVSEELVKIGIARVWRTRMHKIIAIDLSKLRILLEQLEGKPG